MNQKLTHTPGPWSQGTSKNGSACVWLNGKTEPAHEMGADEDWIDCNTSSNARLIAAAPELLEALKLADAMLSGANMNKAVVERKARAAIALATGKTSEAA